MLLSARFSVKKKTTHKTREISYRKATFQKHIVLLVSWGKFYTILVSK